MKNKRLKYIIAIGLIAIALVIGKNIDRIRFSLSLLDIYRVASNNSNKNEQALKESPSKEVIVENPLENIPREEKPVDEIVETEDSQPNNEVVENDPIKPSEIIVGTPAKENIRTLTSITEEYNNKFTELQSELENSINKLIDTAYSEYQSGLLSKSQLASKYIDEGVLLEKSADDKFYNTLEEFEHQLKENYYETALVDQVKNYYEIFKNEKKTDLVSKGMEMVKK